MNLGDSLNQVLAQSGFLEQQQFAGSSDVDLKQMVAIADRVALEMLGYYNWGVLRRTFAVTVLPEQNRYPLPNDFYAFVPDSVWELDGSRPCNFPVAERRWFMYKFSGLGSGTGTIQIQKYANELEIAYPEESDEFVFEYLSKFPIRAADGELKQRFTDDTDEILFDNQTFILGVQAAWADTKMLPQTPQWTANYYKKMHEAIARDAGTQTVGGVGLGFDFNPPYTNLWVR